MRIYPDIYNNLAFDLEPYLPYCAIFKYSKIAEYIPKDLILGEWYYQGHYFLIYDIQIDKAKKEVRVYFVPYGSLAQIIIYGIIGILSAYLIYLILQEIRLITEEAPAVGATIIFSPLLIIILIVVVLLLFFLKK